MSCIVQSALFTVNHLVFRFELLVYKSAHHNFGRFKFYELYASGSQHLRSLHDVISIPNQALYDDQQNGDRC